MEFLANMNLTIDPKTNSVRELTSEEIEKLKKKRQRDQGFKL